MKIILCGPPHSGKSVFIANLIEKLPTDAYTIIRACPDGEGTWSNNKNQNETSIVRKKGKFTKKFIEDSCKSIDNQTNKIVLVDVGGIMSKENEQIFKHCDSFVVLSSDEKKKKEWLEFGQKQGLECVGCLDSSLEGEEKIYSRNPYLQGRIVGLERGELLENSQVINAITSDIVKKSKYNEKDKKDEKNIDGTIIDDTEFGFELGYGKEILTEDGIAIKKVRWDEKAVPIIHKTIGKKVMPGEQLKINGIRANFALCAICKSAKEKGVKNISAYDIRLKKYVPIKDIPKKKGTKQTEGLSYKIIKNKENVFMDIDITKEQYSLEDYEKCILPQIEEEKNLYISGRMPLWLLASISNSYNAKNIFTFQPGKGFTCISSNEEKNLGKVVNCIDGININKYFEDKRNNSKENLPAVIEKNNIFSKVKRWIKGLKDEKENKKYLDETIIAEIVEQPEENKKYKEKLEEENVKPIKDITLTDLRSKEQQEDIQI